MESIRCDDKKKEDEVKCKAKGREFLASFCSPDEDESDQDYHTKTTGEILPFSTYTSPILKVSPRDKLNALRSPDRNQGYSLVRPRRMAQTVYRTSKLATQLTRTQSMLSPVATKLMRLKHKNDRTPNTLLRIERHRQNERVRHHSLNKSMMNVCNKVPGIGNFLKETKVVMMQRIIAYICYLENTLQSVCDNLGLRISQLRLPTNLLTEQWQPNADRSKAKASTVGCSKPSRLRVNLKESIGSCMRPYRTRNKLLKRLEPVAKRHLKVSSPTIDSTTDNTTLELNQNLSDTCSFELPQVKEEPVDCHSSSGTMDFQRIEKPYGDDMDVFLDHNACAAPSSIEDTPAYFTEDFLPTSTTLDNFPDAFELMSSPLGARSKYVLLSPKLRAMDSLTDFGIRSDKKDFVEQWENIHEMRTISPECVLPTTPSPHVHSMLHDSCGFRTFHQVTPYQSSNDDILRTPDKSTLKLKNKRKQYTPHRSPFHNLTNFSSQSTMASTDSEEDQPLSVVLPKHKKPKSHLPLVRPSKIDEDFVSYVPYIWKFHNTAITRRQKAEAARLEAQLFSSSSSDIRQADQRHDKHLAVTRPNKIDHRKTTWMNGFMMFSRLNRRTFIDANPGIHTSHISKMMGHAWRNMSPQEQQPYKEKAKDYARHMQPCDGKVPLQDDVPRTPVVSSSGLNVSLNNSDADEEKVSCSILE
ncbi:uncharacterized protein LOC132559189 [Ylistrum balloti]|uniref:uncharacterized protein LOC132559189 n=1 Tax=Ylistrum balloti TaxID=509963 RepID=UPI002905B999|nr:uncharacterized protein LOC132559189 [Ylistrum balloti]